LNSTLLLNSSYEPLKVISWERAITLLFLGKVEVVENYERDVRSVSLVIKIPCVVRLLKFVKLGQRRPPLTKLNLLARDSFSCQYCQKKLSRIEATFDHVLPRSQGGDSSWENLVIACPPCNRKKGGRTPKQARMTLKKEPQTPEWLPIINIDLHQNAPKAWKFFLITKFQT